MIPANEKLNALLKMLALTRESEMDCGGCLKKMAEFAECSLAGKSIPEGMRAIEEHLELCGDCREEFESLKVALSHELDE